MGLLILYGLMDMFVYERSNAQELGGYPLQHPNPKVQGIDRAKFGVIVHNAIK